MDKNNCAYKVYKTLVLDADTSKRMKKDIPFKYIAEDIWSGYIIIRKKLIFK